MRKYLPDNCTIERDADDPEPVSSYVRGCLGCDRSPTSLDFHDYCQIFPAELLPDERFYSLEANNHRRLNAPPPMMRFLFRIWPVVMVVVTVFVFVVTPLLTGVDGPWQLLPTLPTITYQYLLVVPLLLSAIVIYYLLKRIELLRSSESLLKLIVVYALVVVLLLATLASIWLVWQTDDPHALDDNVVFVSGYLLMWTICGILGYDLIVKGEELFDTFHYTNIISNPDMYESEFHSELDRLWSMRLLDGNESFYNIRLSYVFGAVVVSYFGAFWYFTQGPQYLDSTPILVVNVFFNFLLLTGVFQLLIVSKHLYLLLEEKIEADDEILEIEYRPSHLDGKAGFRDLGRAAMRINLLIVLGGLYLAYRLFVQGNRAIEGGGIEAIDTLTTLELAIWGANFVLPIAMYVVVVVFWLYAAFWRIHVKMTEKKEELILENQRQNRYEQQKPLEHEQGDEPPYGDMVDKSAYDQLKNAPTWPIEREQFQSLVVTNLLPVFALLPNFIV